jgi:L-amino acid N-acyltransferase YncA
MSSMSGKPENAASAVIRLATERDAEEIVAIYAPNVSDTIISFELEPPTAD